MENLWVESSKEHIKRSGNGYKRPKNVRKKSPDFFGTKPRLVRLQSLGPNKSSLLKYKLLLFTFHSCIAIIIEIIETTTSITPIATETTLSLWFFFYIPR